MVKKIALLILIISGCKNLGNSAPVSELNSTPISFKEGPGSIVRVADPGAGPHSSKLWTWEKWRSREVMKAQLFGAGWIYGHDAARHLYHYFGNTGEELQIDAKRFFRECPGARVLYLKWLKSAFELVRGLPDGQHEFSLTANESGACKKEDSVNWYYATGGFNVYFRGLAVIEERVSPAWRTLTFVAQYYDRYNWDVGDSFVINNTETRESNMGEFHLMGLAKEYDLSGEYLENFTWRDDQGFDVLQEQFDAIKK